MERNVLALNMFSENSVEQDEISPSITFRRSRRLRNSAPQLCDLVYTENVWAAINNTLAGCAEFNAWQQATNWVVVTDQAHQGDATNLLKGCESLAHADASVEMIDSSGFSNTLNALHPDTPAVVVMALSTESLKECVSVANAWHETHQFTGSNVSQLHLLWLPHDRAAQSEPVEESLEELAWASLTIVCDLAKLSTNTEPLNESLVTMLRVSIFIDAQFLHWIEGNLSALASCDEQLHRKAIIRSANALFTVKRRRSEEPNLPMAFTDTVALRYTRAADAQTPVWQVKARQLLIDVRYAVAMNEIPASSAERILRVMTSLNLLTAAEDVHALIYDEPTHAYVDAPFLILKDFGNAHSTREFVLEAWRAAQN